ncbi:MAG: DsbA family protein [Thiobacillus sp.]|nr:DsbA family protein [Thiobacillus sp.]
MDTLLIVDPMCSWCYGFASEVDAARRLVPGFDPEVVVAGLWAGNRAVLDDAGKRFRLMHWDKVEAAAGVPFNRDALRARQGFVYDTEPVSRAFVAGRHCLPGGDQLRLLRALQKAFYVDGLDTTAPAVLADILQAALVAQGVARTHEALVQLMDSADIREATRQEFERVRAWGYTSVPQLLCREGEGYALLHSGFANASQIASTIAARRDCGLEVTV